MVVAVPAQVALPDGLTSYYKEHLLPQLESSAGTECGSQFNTEVDNPEPDDQDREEQQDSTAKDTDVLPDERDELPAVTPTLEIGTRMKTLMPREIVGVTSGTGLATERRILAPPPPV